MLNTLNIPKELRRKIDNELQPGEMIRWVDQPVPGFLTGVAIGSLLFGVPWTSFALFWTWGALGFRTPDWREGFRPEYMFALFGVPFIVIGLGMLSAPLWVWQQARHTVYVITDQRAISFQGKGNTTIKSYFPNQLKNIHRTEKNDGTGDVIISVRHWKDSDGDPRSEEIGFLGIRNVKEVEKRLKDLAQNSD